MLLPIQENRPEIERLVRENQVLVLSSETGTGKTTQVPRYIYEMFKESVVCSQPRRIAAISIARRVSEEIGTPLGSLVGYSVRFEERTSEQTMIRYVTDGTLLRDFIDDPLVKKYKAVIIDEVHERTINIDLLLGLVKDAIRDRPDLKIIIMSATMATEKFLTYLPGSATFHIKSRSYPIDLKYTPLSSHEKYVEKAIKTVIDIHNTQPPGDILVFLTGEDEIETCCREISSLQRSFKNKLVPLPLYSSLPLYAQNAIFEDKGGRKVIFATNIAETSITIESIVYVIDCGYSKQKVFDSAMKSEMLLKLLISKSSADQRKGRAGRVRAGICYRLYEEEVYHKMEDFTIPEILRGELSSLVLKMARLGIKNLVTFDFIEPPLPDSVIVALNQLYFLGGIDANGEITEEGVLMVEFPLEPRDAKTLLESIRYSVEEEIATLAAMTGNMIFDKKKFDLANETSDHLAYYFMMKDYEEARDRRRFCYDHGINEKNMENAIKSKKQIKSIIEKIRPYIKPLPFAADLDKTQRVESALLGGYLLQTAKSTKERQAVLAGTGAPVQIRRLVPPVRTNSRRSPRCDTWVFYRELTKMDGKYVIRMVSNVSSTVIEGLFKKHTAQLKAIGFSPAAATSYYR
ncbi:pre-mRNA-splicing factor ATP-dependent RNA helicase DHX16 [Nematocida homosporus]|uniref:pre-mRNA-splicing factor ATP-dependent RNA helicase DHX16 n=1 Tax=Nematocida homosporus TaxID=1912981 RepID=UPI00221FF123|nr:pre-mRNA-splicing factor ATP-dependent RNA helicase DHX16 [Nematocida homosporus]KAI5187995.1 pre-mRNA-splicing factor ATP-dependent RNA helicase DHX16 [Nematocida homosporus]